MGSGLAPFYDRHPGPRASSRARAYPPDAVREAITNAVCHRDYADSGNVVVRVFDDRLEVSNPGGLPAGMTVEDLKKPHESRPRNKLVADAFFLIKYIEQFGTGIQRIINDCREAGVPEPEFESRGDTFRTVFRRVVSDAKRFAGQGLKEGQLKALQHVLDTGRISRAEYEQIASVKSATAKRGIGDLVKRRILAKKVSGTNYWYEMANGPYQGEH